MLTTSLSLPRCPPLLLTAAMALTACYGQPDDICGPEGEVSVSILHELGVPASFAIAPTAADGSGSFAIALGVGESGEDEEIQLAVVGGVVSLWAARGEILLLQDLSVEIADVSLSDGVIGPAGAELTNLRARLSAPVTLEVTDSHERIGAIANASLRADWTLELPDGTAYPMSALRLDEVSFALEVERAGPGELSARLVAFRSGTFWRWADRFALSDLVVDLFASR